jgi:protein-disulfide isomerase
VVNEVAATQFCPCGCPHRVGVCARGHASCRHAKRAVTLAALLAKAGASAEDAKKAVQAYYASFDRRAKLDVTAFGPPLGDAAAKVTLVEFSDFGCPFCQLVRPELEKWVAGRSGVRFFYKPFPLDMHPGAYDAAETGEWAREKGLFWKMHDALFSTPVFGVDDLATRAGELGADEGDLRDALQSHRYLDKVHASQAEARAAGLRGTPTLYVNGRQHVLPIQPAFLDFAIEDELEWAAHGGWTKD